LAGTVLGVGMAVVNLLPGEEGSTSEATLRAR
jgi:hypothetical protein